MFTQSRAWTVLSLSIRLALLPFSSTVALADDPKNIDQTKTNIGFGYTNYETKGHIPLINDVEGKALSGVVHWNKFRAKKNTYMRGSINFQASQGSIISKPHEGSMAPSMSNGLNPLETPATLLAFEGRYSSGYRTPRVLKDLCSGFAGGTSSLSFNAMKVGSFTQPSQLAATIGPELGGLCGTDKILGRIAASVEARIGSRGDEEKMHYEKNLAAEILLLDRVLVGAYYMKGDSASSKSIRAQVSPFSGGAKHLAIGVDYTDQRVESALLEKIFESAGLGDGLLDPTLDTKVTTVYGAGVF